MSSSAPTCTACAAPVSLAALSPCVAVHTEETQLPRYADRTRNLELSHAATRPHRVTVLATSSPLIYARAHEQCHPSESADSCARRASSDALEQNALLRQRIEDAFGSGRIRAHRVYQLDWSCTDAEWIPMAAPMRALKQQGTQRLLARKYRRSERSRANSCERSFNGWWLRRAGASFRVVAFPKQLQDKMAVLLHSHGYETHPKAFSHELYVTMQPSVSPYIHYGVAPRSASTSSAPSTDLDTSKAPINAATTERPGTATVAADAPCRAYFKMEESLQYVPLRAGDRVLDVGASPGGWTECLLKHGAHVVAVDPGELTIDVAGKPVVHLQMLLEDAAPQLARMAPFAMCVCDINVRVQHMAALMARVAPLLEPGASVVLTLKLGKKPTAQAVETSVEAAMAVLAPSFEAFRLLWLHANTQNERTLVARKRSSGSA